MFSRQCSLSFTIAVTIFLIVVLFAIAFGNSVDNLPPKGHNMDTQQICFGGSIRDVIKKEGYTIYICEAKANNSKYLFWVEGFKGEKRLTPLQIKLLLMKRATVK